MKISATIGRDPIMQAINELEQYQRRMQQKIETFMERIADEACDEAAAVYGEQVAVFAVFEDNGFRIIAGGDQVCFLEFGAGEATDNSHPMAGQFQSETGIPVEPGAYSKTHAMQFTRQGYWKYDNQTYTEIVPKPGLWRARQLIERRAREIAQEVFGHD